MPSDIYLAKGAVGHLVKKLQVGITKIGIACGVDGDFGSGTETALKSAQSKLSVPVTGVVDAVTWRGLVKADVPSLYERCLMLTANFEGHGFTLAAGNWDGAGLTWGIIGFTLGSGSLYEVLKRIPFADVAACFGESNANSLLAAARNKDKTWADSISQGPNKHKLQEPWQSSFWKLGGAASAQGAQMAVAQETYWAAAQKKLQASLPTLTSERAAAIAFDCAVNQGGMYKTAIAYAQAALAAGKGEQAALEAIAKGQMDGMNSTAKAKYGQDVFTRRLTLAQGFGKVHGRVYELSDYGINLVPR